MAKTSPNDISNTELLDAMHAGFQHMEDRFQGLEGRMGGLDGRMGGLDGRMDGLEGKVVEMDQRLTGRIDEMDVRLTGKIDDLTTAVDGLAKRHLDADEAIVMERSARERLEERVGTLESKIM